MASQTSRATGNIIDYARTRTGSFDERPFNDVDALVLASLAYQTMPDVVPTLADWEHRYGTTTARWRTLMSDPKTALRHPLNSLRALRQPDFPATTLADAAADLHPQDFDHNAGYTGLADPKLTEALFAAMARNPRFSSIHVGAVDERFSREHQTQFAAMTLLLPDGTLVVSFRGTDTSFVGWKEDFNMAFQYPVPAQQLAADYVTRVARLWQGDLVLLGHSKGGNLAVYAALQAGDDVLPRIRRVYSLDGPGFPADVVAGDRYRAVADRIVKIIPDSSIVGMILDSPEHCVVVKSNEYGPMQHLAFSWQVDRDRFVTVPEVSVTSREFKRSLDRMLAGMTPDQCERVVDALFKVLTASDEHGLIGLMEAGPKTIPAMLGAFAGLTDEERQHILEAAGILLKASFPLPWQSARPSS